MPKLQFDVESLATISDPRELPAYTIPEVSRHLGIPRATVRSWVVGMSTTDGWFKPVIEPPSVKRTAKRRPVSLSFNNLAEMFVLRGMREYRVPLHHIRQAIDAVRQETGWSRPLIQEDFRSDGARLFVERLGQLVDAVTRQRLLPGVLETRLLRIDWADSLAARVYPFTRRDERSAAARPVVIDYRRSFGRPIVDSIGVATEVIYGRWIGGDTQKVIADDFRCQVSDIEEALCYESAAHEAA